MLRTVCVCFTFRVKMLIQHELVARIGLTSRGCISSAEVAKMSQGDDLLKQ